MLVFPTASPDAQPAGLVVFPPQHVTNLRLCCCRCDNFLPAEVCDALLTAAKESGHMKASEVGGIGDLSDNIRTSSTLAITKDILAACPALKAPLQQLLDAALQLVGQGLDTSALSSMQFVRPSSADQLCPELPQIAHYLPGAPGISCAASGMWCGRMCCLTACAACVFRECLAQFVVVLAAYLCPPAGQHFLAHEDGFPAAAALEKGYNRRATLLVYLNNVPEVRPGGGSISAHHECLWQAASMAVGFARW